MTELTILKLTNVLLPKVGVCVLYNVQMVYYYIQLFYTSMIHCMLGFSLGARPNSSGANSRELGLFLSSSSPPLRKGLAPQTSLD